MNITVELDCIECCVCHVMIYLSKEHTDRLREKGSYFFCPNGHTQHFTKPTIPTLRSDLEKKGEELRICRIYAEKLERELAAAKKPKKRGRPKKVSQ
jgi:hypothetical protein